MRTTKNKTEFNPGDVVSFHKRNWIVLEKVETETGATIYHIFCPDYKVYSVLEDEIKYVDHLLEYDTLVGKLNEISLKKVG